MRVLFTTRPLAGHYYPMRPLASALAAAGDVVAVASGEPIVNEARAEGYKTYRVGHAFDDPAVLRMRQTLRTLPPDEIRGFAFSEYFVRTEVPARLEGLKGAIEDFEPDAIVHETAEFAGPLAATAQAIPYATHAFGPLLRSDAASVAGDAAAPFWRELGLTPHPLAGLYEHLYLDICPPRLQAPAILEIKNVQPIGRSQGSPAPIDMPWLEDIRGQSTIYVTLGTVFNEDLKVFATIVEAIRDEADHIVVTVGASNDPAALGSQPKNVHVHRFIEQDVLLPRCSTAVLHGGAGSTFGALAHGLPLVVLPQSADQFYNAERVAAAGAGIALMPRSMTAASVRDATRTVLAEASYRAAAQSIQNEFAAMPKPAEIRPVLVRLAGERRR